MISPIGDSSLPGGRAQDRGVAADRIDAVVIHVLVRHQQQIRLDALDRRVVELHAATRRHRRHVRERVDRHGLVCGGEEKGGLAVPLNLHAVPLGWGLG